jgi:hypothetical protein
LSRVAVQEVRSVGGSALAVSTASTQVIIRVAPDNARRVVAALGTESTIRLVVLDGELPMAPAATGSVDGCGPAGAGRRKYQAGSGGMAADTLPAPSAAPSAPAGQSPAPPSASTTPTGGSR